MKHPFIVIGGGLLLLYLYEQSQTPAVAAAGVPAATTTPSPVIVSHVDGAPNASLSTPIQTILPAVPLTVVADGGGGVKLSDNSAGINAAGIQWQTVVPGSDTGGGTSFVAGPGGFALTITAAENPNAHTGPVALNIANAQTTAIVRADTPTVNDDLNFGGSNGASSQVTTQFGRYIGLRKIVF